MQLSFVAIYLNLRPVIHPKQQSGCSYNCLWKKPMAISYMTMVLVHMTATSSQCDSAVYYTNHKNMDQIETYLFMTAANLC